MFPVVIATPHTGNSVTNLSEASDATGNLTVPFHMRHEQVSVTSLGFLSLPLI
jgi:hypothetical protein